MFIPCFALPNHVHLVQGHCANGLQTRQSVTSFVVSRHLLVLWCYVVAASFSPHQYSVCEDEANQDQAMRNPTLAMLLTLGPLKVL